MIETKYTLLVKNKNSSQQEKEIINELEEISFEIQNDTYFGEDDKTKFDINKRHKIFYFINHVLFFKGLFAILLI